MSLCHLSAVCQCWVQKSFLGQTEQCQLAVATASWPSGELKDVACQVQNKWHDPSGGNNNSRKQQTTERQLRQPCRANQSGAERTRFWRIFLAGT